MIAALADHLWQSTLFAGAAGLLTLMLRHNGARARFWLWFAASLKFLLPFALLAMVGEKLAQLLPVSRTLLVIPAAAERFSAPAHTLAVPHAPGLYQGPDLFPLLLGIWLLGLCVILALRASRWWKLRAMIVAAADLDISLAVPGTPVAIKSSVSLLEPGLVGVFKPVVLLPQGLMRHLSDSERDSILAHELGHLRRRDNVTAAIHMAVEALFWFYPPVWLIGARLIAERERACDESVLAQGHDPEVYAGSILKVCKFCIRSPLACAAGVTGADLKGRVRLIMTGAAARRLGAGKRLALAGAAVTALALPIAAGFLSSPLAVPLAKEMQRKVAVLRTQMTENIVRNVAVVSEQIGVTPVQVQARRLPRMLVVTAPAPTALPDAAPAQPQAPTLAMAVPSAPASNADTRAEAAPTPSTARDGTHEAVLALYPSGAGEPEAITCRVPQLLPGSRLPGPEVCKVNRVWAQLRAEGKDISPDGTTVIATLSNGRVTQAGCVNNLPMLVRLSNPTLSYACR